MSSDDPSDEELEREQQAHVPLPAGTSIRHAPRLDVRSRAINPRALLAAEARAQSREPSRELLDFPRIDELPRAQPRPVSVSSLRARLLQPKAEEPKPSYPDHEARAWDTYVAAVLPSASSLEEACELADVLLEERRRRFSS